MLTLYVIHHSPWSERARWALLHHKLRFEEREHVPLIGELSLRMRAKNTKGKVSVPLLVDDEGESVQGSLAIGEHADRIGKRAKLFPEGVARTHPRALRRVRGRDERRSRTLHA